VVVGELLAQILEGGSLNLNSFLEGLHLRLS
jgi:hypothetical protein